MYIYVYTYIYFIYIHIYIYIYKTFWQSSETGVLSTLVTSVVLYLLTRATVMSPGKEETRVCRYIYIYIYIYIKLYLVGGRWSVYCC